MVTHHIFRAKQIASHIGIMNEGCLVESFRSEDITLKALEDLYLETIDS